MKNKLNELAKTLDKDTSKQIFNAKTKLAKLKILKKALDRAYDLLDDLAEDAMESGGSFTVGSPTYKEFVALDRETEAFAKKVKELEEELTTEDLRDTDSYEFSKKKGSTYVVTFMDKRNPQYIQASSIKDATQKAYKKWAEEEIMEIYEDTNFSALIDRLNAITLR